MFIREFLSAKAIYVQARYTMLLIHTTYAYIFPPFSLKLNQSNHFSPQQNTQLIYYLMVLAEKLFFFFFF